MIAPACLLVRCAVAALMWSIAGQTCALTLLADDALSDMVGRDGVSMVIDGANWSTQSLNYTQDGETLSLTGLSSRPVSGASSLSMLRLDALSTGMVLSYSAPQTEYRIDNVALGTGIRSFGSLRGFINTDATVGIKPKDPLIDTGVSLDGNVLLSNGTVYAGFEGYDLIAKGVRLGVNFTDATFSLPAAANGNDVKLAFNQAAVTAGFSGLTLDLAFADATPGVPSTPLSPDTRDANSLRSLGSLALDINASGSFTLTGGGAKDQGIRIKPDVSWTGGVLEYKDTGVIRSSDFSGSISSTAGLTIDLEKDTTGSYIKFAASDLSVVTQLGKLVVGDPSNSKLGSVGLSLLFMDTPDRGNWVKLRPGGDANSGSRGVTAQMSWNLASGAASITDNNNSLWLSGLRSYGSGSMTLDLTRSCSVTTPVCYGGTLTDPTQGNYNGYFDGLRLGFSNVIASYSLDGLRVGTSSAPLQGGTELLLLTGLFPAYDFTLNGHVTLLPGGKTGDGLRFNADVFLSNVNAAVSTDEYGKGIWLTDASNEMHYRNGSVDVSSAGLEINKGESWSKLEANDLRLGTKAAGTSIGRLVLKTYELNSSLSLATGGSGTVCVGATASTSTGCATAGGRWEDRGNEGLSVKLKSLFVRDTNAAAVANGVVSDEKRNQLLLEARRSVGTDGKPVNGTGVQIVLDNFWTSDANVADANANSYGFNAELGVDVAPTVVISKVPPYTQTAPLGFAVNGRVSFKEMGAERLQTVHPTGGAQTVMYGMRMQNADVRFNLTATPIN